VGSARRPDKSSRKGRDTNSKMAHSGIKLREDAVQEFMQLKKKDKKSVNKILYFLISSPPDTEEIVCAERRPYFGSSDKTDKENFVEFLQDLAARYAEHPVYVVYDFHYYRKQSHHADVSVSNDKIILICWSPDNAPVKKKMLFASTKDHLKRSFEGVSKEFQASDMDDLDFDHIVSTLN